MRRSYKWLAAVAAALFIPALLVASGANAAGKISDPCLDTVSARAGSEGFVTETIDGFSYTDEGMPLADDTTTYDVTWSRTEFLLELFVAAGCTAAETGNYRVNLLYPDGTAVSTTATSVTNDPTGAATLVTFRVPLVDVVADSAGETETRGTDRDRVFVYVETLGGRGQVVDRAPDSGTNELCEQYQSTDPTAACYHDDGGGSGYWN